MSVNVKSAMKTAAKALCLFVPAVVVGALLDIYVFQFSEPKHETEQTYLREIQESGVTQEIAVSVAMEAARQGGWADEKDAITDLAVYLKACVDKAISDRLNSNSADSTRRVSVDGISELTRLMTIECIDKLKKSG